MKSPELLMKKPREDISGDAPLVSVIIPAYQAADFISEAVDSALAQRFTDREVIVVNDGSPDTERLEAVLEPYADRIVYLVQENGGPSLARNHGILHARGELVAFLDADDAWDPDFLEAQVGYLREHPAIALVYSDARYFGDSHLSGRTFMSACPSRGAATLESLLAGRCQVLTSSVLARKRALIDAGLFDPSESWGEDYDLWLRVAKGGGRIGYQPRVLAKKRVHSASLGADPLKLQEGGLRVLRKFARRDDLTPSEKTALARRLTQMQALRDLTLGKARLAAGDFAGARTAISAANEHLCAPKLDLALQALRVAPRLVARVHAAKLKLADLGGRSGRFIDGRVNPLKQKVLRSAGSWALARSRR
ncbi:hypothetical protein BH23GEM3_BH23GEM3_17460 [soil metagenome]